MTRAGVLRGLLYGVLIQNYARVGVLPRRDVSFSFPFFSFLSFFLSFFEIELLILHVLRCTAKLLETFDDFVHGVQEIFFTDCFPSLPNGKHPCFGTDAMDFRARAVWTQSTQQLESNVSFHRHRPSMNLKNLSPTFQIRQTKLNFSIQSTRS